MFTVAYSGLHLGATVRFGGIFGTQSEAEKIAAGMRGHGYSAWVLRRVCECRTPLECTHQLAR